ncbi:MAG TPA: M48 family metalloprotease [Candidatus Acidoferrales bacterium]|nr:M48 family metalloprotease [Candidatus Acidoferrales bacterium]
MSKMLRSAALAVVAAFLFATPCRSATKLKIRGYITAKPDAQTLQILDDTIHLTSSTRFDVQNAGEEPRHLRLEDLATGLLIEAEGHWTARHQFAAESITCDAAQFGRQLKEHAYLQTEPAEAGEIATGQPARLKVDGEILALGEKTQRDWKPGAPGAETATEKENAGARLVGRQVHYEGVRQPDGTIAAERVELGPGAPADAYKIPGGISVARRADPQTGIDVLEFDKGDKVQGRLKLFDVKEVQRYVTDLGFSLLPPAKDVTARALEFRFFVVEDEHINAAAFPDGTILINTGLLGAVENEAELAFVLSHEIAHVLQAHQWREANETRAKRVALVVAAVAGAYFIGNLSLFLGELGMAAVVNGYSRRIENQADRLGLQNVVDHGYDPRAAVTFFRTTVEHYRDRSTSSLWSNHDSSLLRGSFITTQLAREYPAGQFDHSIVDTDRFKAMKEAMGPVKIM